MRVTLGVMSLAIHIHKTEIAMRMTMTSEGGPSRRCVPKHGLGTSWWLALLVLLLIAAPAHAQTLLRWKFVKDQRFEVTGTQQTEVETSLNGKPQKAYLEMTMELTWLVDDVDAAGVATLTQSFTRLAIKTTAPQSEAIGYDSASATKPTGAAKEIAAGVAPLLGAKFTVKMDARGDIKEVTLTDEAQQALAALPADSQIKQVLSPAGITQLFRLGGGVLPEKEVNAGDTWPAVTETATPYGALSQETKFTFASLEEQGGRTLAKLTFAAVDTLTPQADAPVKLEIKEQTKRGEILLDVAAGYVAASESKLVSKSARPYRNQTIQVTIDSKTKLHIERK